MKLTVNNHKSLLEAIGHIQAKYGQGGYFEITMKPATRTSQQNKALHKYCSLLSEALNDAGLDIRKTMRADVDIPWTETAVKELIWRPVQKAVTDKTSSAQLDRSEVSKVFDVINRHISQKGVSVPFPSVEK